MREARARRPEAAARRPPLTRKRGIRALRELQTVRVRLAQLRAEVLLRLQRRLGCSKLDLRGLGGLLLLQLLLLELELGRERGVPHLEFRDLEFRCRQVVERLLELLVVRVCAHVWLSGQRYVYGTAL